MRTGRPRLPDEERRVRDMKIPLSSTEWELIHEAAKADGQKPVPWARNILLLAVKSVIPTVAPEVHLDKQESKPNNKNRKRATKETPQ